MKGKATGVIVNPDDLDDPEVVKTIAETIGPEEIKQSTRDTLYGTPLRDREPTEYELATLRGLQQLPHVYQGTVDPVTVAERRRRNKAARRSRRVNRRAS